MCKSELKGVNVPIKIWTDIHSVESQALDQLKNISALPWVFKHVAVMPDVHYGKGATVGSVIAMKNAVSPAAVGVDIGCGMGAIRTNIMASQLPENLSKIRHQIERDVPVGFNWHNDIAVNHLFKHGETYKLANNLFNVEFDSLSEKAQALKTKSLHQCGTLGGGNHFIELCLDKQDRVWLMLHSGSRNIGKELAELHISKARELIHNQELPDKDLAVFLSKTKEMDEYRRDLFWAQRYAYLNRLTMFELCMNALRKFFPLIQEMDRIICHHNYVSEETHFGEDLIVTRKGAIDAHKGIMGIIPGSMGAQSFIVRGLGNENSFCSASHGAGRRMSRGQAKRSFTESDLLEQTKGVECRKDLGVLDEIPGAYKDIREVMENQSDLVEIVEELKQVLCVKG
jgi:tRNA-splicing ligase RtcB